MISTLLVLLLLLQIKHMFADYYLQTKKMMAGRGEYFHLGRAQHAGVHVIGSLIVLVIMGTPVWALAVLLIGEWILHFHIDYWKGSYSCRKELAPDQAAFWRAFGFDQFLHQISYLGMAWLWTMWAV